MKEKNENRRRKARPTVLLAFSVCLAAAAMVQDATAGIVGGDRALASKAAAYNVYAYPFAAVGPVEAIDARNRTISILGQTYSVAADSVLFLGGAKTQPQRAFALLRVGDYVALGANNRNGVLVAAVAERSADAYVPGASAVFVRGIVAEARAASGQARIGKLWIDFTPALANGVGAIDAGSFASFSGTQPALGGFALAVELNSRGIVGGDVSFGIVGGDATISGIVGGDVSISGIVGGDRIHGIVGGDLTSGIIGGDAAISGIVGGDVAINGIVGGDRKRGIVGGDRLNGIVGGDAAINGIVGGDVAINGIVGGDVSINGIVGGDRIRK